MKRYYSHYTVVFPSLFLKDHLMEFDDDGRLVQYYPFEREMGHTEFHSGLLVFFSPDDAVDLLSLRQWWDQRDFSKIQAYLKKNQHNSLIEIRKRVLKVIHFS